MPERRLILAAAVRDAAGVSARPGAVAVEGDRIIIAGSPDMVRSRCGQVDRVVELPDHLVLPAMVNAHAHLDLTGLGRRPYSGDFIQWIEMVMRDRPRPEDEAGICAAVREGLRLSREAGVGWIGDIAGSIAAIEARFNVVSDMPVSLGSSPTRQGAGQASLVSQPAPCRAGLGPQEGGIPSVPDPDGVSYLECFGLGGRQEQAAQAALAARAMLSSRETKRLRIELQPHAPYSAGLALYEAACVPSNPPPAPGGRGPVDLRPLARALPGGAWAVDGAGPCTHLAETRAELEFIRDAAGPFADLLRRMGKWDETIRPTGLTPVAYLRGVLHQARWLAVHCNYVSDADIAILASAKASVAYCPIASEYFGEPHGSAHRYRDMIAAGINICLGTDSILCQPRGERQPLGILPAMRRLYLRDGAAPDMLLAMATVNGAAALGLEEGAATLREGAPVRLMCVEMNPRDDTDPLEQVLRGDAMAMAMPA